MAILVSWTILLSVLSVVHLLFTFGVVRRLREHTRLLSQRPGGHDDGGVMLAKGEPVGEFSAATVDGRRVTLASFAGPTLVGFFSPSCPACVERLPGFRTLAATMPGQRAQVLAVAVGGAEETAHLRAELAEVATVLVDDDKGPLVRAFGVRGYPAFAVLDADGVVLDSGFDTDQIALPVSS